MTKYLPGEPITLGNMRKLGVARRRRATRNEGITDATR